MNPLEVRLYIDSRGVPYGQNVVLPDDVDACGCQEFFGTRCPHNVHVKGRRRAHVDRVDTRRDPIGHLKKDVGVPYAAMATLGGAVAGATVAGATVAKNNRVSGAVGGGLAGLVLGAIADILAIKN